MSWIVYTYQTVGAQPVHHAYGCFDQTADADAGKPFDQATAWQLAANINGNTGQDGIRAMALPLEAATQPGV